MWYVKRKWIFISLASEYISLVRKFSPEGSGDKDYLCKCFGKLNYWGKQPKSYLLEGMLRFLGKRDKEASGIIE